MRREVRMGLGLSRSLKRLFGQYVPQMDIVHVFFFVFCFVFSPQCTYETMFICLIRLYA